MHALFEFLGSTNILCSTVTCIVVSLYVLGNFFPNSYLRSKKVIEF